MRAQRPNEITGADAGGPRLFTIWTRRVARAAQFWLFHCFRQQLGVVERCLEEIGEKIFWHGRLIALPWVCKI